MNENKPTERDLIEEAEALLASVPAWKLTAAEWGNEIRIGYYEHGSRFTVAKVHTFEGPDIDKPLAQLFADSPELLRRLVAEVKALRRGEFICQRCHHRKDADFEPGDF